MQKICAIGMNSLDSVGINSHQMGMERFVSEIETYVAALGVTPQKFLRDVIGAQWGQWQKWKDGTSSPTMRIADKIRDYMAENPPQPAASAAPTQEQSHENTSDGC